MSSAAISFSILAPALSDDPRQAPRLARQLGFAGLQFDIFSPQLNLPDLSGSGKRDFKHLLVAQDQQLASLLLDIGPRGLTIGAYIDRIIARLDTSMETAATLNCRLICVDLGPLPGAPVQPKPKKPITQDQLGLLILPSSLTAAPAADQTTLEQIPSTIDPNFTAQVDGALAEIGRRADRYGVTLALRTELSPFASLDRALGAAGCPNFAIDLDPVAIVRDDWTIDEIFSQLGGAIRHIRARDALRGDAHRTKPAPIGQGNVNWQELLSNLDDAGYRGWLTLDPLELPNRAQAALSGLNFLRNLSMK